VRSASRVSVSTTPPLVFSVRISWSRSLAPWQATRSW